MARVWSLLECQKSLADFLERYKVENPRLCSEILISKSLDMRRIDIYAQFDRPMTPAEMDDIRALGKRLAGGEPLQLVVGDCQFFSFLFKVKKGVFIPRPETETLVDTAVSRLKDRESPTHFHLLDLCTGTGVVAISMLNFLDDASGIAVDISGQAVEIAKENATALGVADRLEIFCGDLFNVVPEGAKFDCITANPPYIPTHDILIIEPVVRDNDPNASLDGGADGLDAVRRIAAAAPARLKPNGFLAMEIGAGQARQACDIMRDAGLCETEMKKDLSGIDRVVIGWQK